MKKLLTGAVLTAALSFSIQAANATTITFDNLYDEMTQSNYQIYDGYYGFDWQEQVLAWDKNYYQNYYPGVAPGTTSGNYSAIYNSWKNPPIEIISQFGLFNFNGVNLIDINQGVYDVRIDGYNGANLVNSDIVSLAGSGPVLYTTEAFNNIDKLIFTSINHTSNNCLQMDDLVFNETPVPEPSSMLLGLMGAGSLLRRFKRKKSA